MEPLWVNDSKWYYVVLGTSSFLLTGSSWWWMLLGHSFSLNTFFCVWNIGVSPQAQWLSSSCPFGKWAKSHRVSPNSWRISNVTTFFVWWITISRGASLHDLCHSEVETMEGPLSKRALAWGFAASNICSHASFFSRYVRWDYRVFPH